ncbi:MAG: hypothetical protein CSA65_01020 [Proteobacteria bacterium]|nr:MAG: hypothetical protein CSA65_01020 [Pseudomonadota bacterium]
MWRTCALITVLSLCACGDGQLVISLVLPEDKRLDPTAACPTAAPCDRIDPRLVRFSLRIHDQSASSSQEALFDSPGELAIGQVPVGRSLDLELSGQSASGQMLGVGRVFDVEIEAKEETRIAINFRKPIAYISGDSALVPIDAASQNPGFSVIPTISRKDLRASATAPNGVLLALVTSQRVYVYSTSNHQLLLDLALDAPEQKAATCLRFSPDSRYLFICRQGPHLSAVDLLAFQPTVLGGAIGKVARDVTFTADGRTGYALTSGLAPQSSCSGAPASELIRFSVGSEAGRVFLAQDVIRLPRPVSDIELNPQNGRLLLAEPCDNRVSELALPASGAAQPQPLTSATLETPYDIAVTGDQIAIIGAAGERGAVVLLSQAATQNLDFAIPPIELSLANQESTAGAFDWTSLPSGQLLTYDLAIAPDGQRAIALYRLRFTSDLTLNGCGFRSDVIGMGYVLLDLSTGAVLLNRLTKLDFVAGGCSAPCISIAGVGDLGDQGRCEMVFRRALRDRGALTRVPFEGHDASVLFGGS